MKNQTFLKKINYKENLFPVNYKLIQFIETENSVLKLEKYVRNPYLKTNVYLVCSTYRPISKILIPYE